MKLLRAKYFTPYGLKRRHASHLDDNGLPMCRVAYRRSFCLDNARTEWIAEIGDVPTCPTCAAKMRKLGGVA